MTQEEIIEMARQAGIRETVIQFHKLEIEAFAKLIAEKEREKSKVGLTDEEIFKVAAFGNDGGYFGDFQWQHDTIGFVKAIESKLKEKNA